MQAIKTLISGYKLSNDWEKAGQLLKGLADNLKTRDAVWEYAEFCYNQNDLAEAEAYFYKCKDILENQSGQEALLARIHNNLAIVYSDTKRFAESEVMYKAALSVCERMAKENPQAYESDLAKMYRNIANFFRMNYRYSESEVMHKDALAIYERLAKENQT